MPLAKCPKPESLLEFVSIPDEMKATERWGVRLHAASCPRCRETLQSLRAKCEALLRPEPDVTSSLLRVYAKLQRDETLILKGWKLGELKPARTWNDVLVKEGWLFRGALAASVLAVLTGLVVTQLGADEGMPAAPPVAERMSRPHIPLAQIRVEDRNTVRVHYVQPELLQSVEFETTSAR